ncbi:phage protein Gp37 [Acinetobacter seifertii]|uniref:phage protein Gp37 n=1 Tax=Acinetobacter seifertii TaxID=1530123 RepID=UPI003AF999C0
MVDLNLSIVEQGIKDVLAQQIKNRTWPWIREIKTYGGEFDEDLTTVADVFPAIWIVFDGSGSPKKTNFNKVEYPLKFVVMMGARSVRNEEARRQGAASDIGTYEMLHRVQQLLIGNDLSSVGVKGLAPLQLGRTKPIFNTSVRQKSISVLAQEFTTQYVITASDRDREDTETDAMLTHVNFNYYFDPTDFNIPNESDLIKLKE